MKIGVLGAGAWGTALAISASRSGHTVTLWCRDSEQAARLQEQRVNSRYLPDYSLPSSLLVAGGPLSGWSGLGKQDVLIIASPMSALREMLQGLVGQTMPVAWLCKGFEQSRAGALGMLGHEIQADVAGRLRAGILSGPSFAQEVAAARPTALVAASPDATVRDALVQAFHSNSLRVYANEDVIGVEVGGAVKNVLAIATGLCDGLALGLNARAALITRGLAEMTRLGLALGARPETFMGLSGLGDLVLTSTGDLSRNRKVGLALAQGQTLEQAVQSLGHVAEGVYCARTVVQRAQAFGMDMPIARCVVALLDGQMQPQQAVAALMGREPGKEGG